MGLDFFTMNFKNINTLPTEISKTFSGDNPVFMKMFIHPKTF